jgi:phosphatidate phosphatase APP1
MALRALRDNPVTHKLIRAGNRLGIVRYEIKRKSGLLNPVTIIAYRGFGTQERAYLTGRVVEENAAAPPTVDDTRWHNFKRTLSWFEAVEVPHARVRIEFAGTSEIVETDDEGYFVAELEPSLPLPQERAWHTAELQLLDNPVVDQGSVRVNTEILTVRPDARFGIISDIDDTVLETHVTSVLSMLRLTFFGNALTRLPFAGTAALYQALQAGISGYDQNPIFYVSRSPWNLYEFLDAFFEQRDIPKGPFFLRDLGLRRRRRRASTDPDHKLAQMRRLFRVYPALSFVLIGDSGERDPELFQIIVNEFPGRVLAAYVRDVTHLRRDVAVHRVAEQVQLAGVPMILAVDSVAAAEHAASIGLIDRSRVRAVRGERSEQEAY